MKSIYIILLFALVASFKAQGQDGNNESRYVVSAAIPKGGIELKIFNNLYSQQTPHGIINSGTRSTFFTTSTSFVYGLTGRFNIGLDLRYRRVQNTIPETSIFGVFGKVDTATNSLMRSGFTNFGPKIRWAPIKNWENFSIQSAVGIPIGKDLEGSIDKIYIDWKGVSWNTQFFNDFSIGNNFSIFTELDFLIENMGENTSEFTNRVSTPVTAIFSYFPTNKSTVYLLTSYSRYWVKGGDYFAQAGLGAKYRLSDDFELEAIYTAFTSEYLAFVNGKASTLNFGIRFSK